MKPICLLLYFLPSSVTLITPPLVAHPTRLGCISPDSNEETFFVSDNGMDDLDSDLVPAPINIRKESILFGENPATKVNSNTMRVWRFLREKLPFIVTGARTPTTADDNPLGAIYNVVFVRIPVILAGFVYGKNLVEGHPLIVDFGEGPLTLSPLVVLAVLVLILR